MKNNFFKGSLNLVYSPRDMMIKEWLIFAFSYFLAILTVCFLPSEVKQNYILFYIVIPYTYYGIINIIDIVLLAKRKITNKLTFGIFRGDEEDYYILKNPSNMNFLKYNICCRVLFLISITPVVAILNNINSALFIVNTLSSLILLKCALLAIDNLFEIEFYQSTDKL